MSEYIEREALIDHMKDLPTWWADDGGVYGKAMKYPEGMFDCEDVISSIENAPVADVIPARHGKWMAISKELGTYECSVCHYWDTNCSDSYATHSVRDQGFCPGCGTKMDGE